MVVTSSRKRVKYTDYMKSPELRQQVLNTLDHNMALGLYAFLFREGRDLDSRWIQLHRNFEYTTSEEYPEYLSVRGEVRLMLAEDEDGGDIE